MAVKLNTQYYCLNRAIPDDATPQDTKKDLKQLRPSVVSGRYAGPRSRRTAEEAVEAAADEEEKGAALAYVTVYHCDSLEPVGTGALRTRFGGSLGLPGFFEYEEGEAGPTDEEMARMVHKTVSGLFSKGDRHTYPPCW